MGTLARSSIHSWPFLSVNLSKRGGVIRQACSSKPSSKRLHLCHNLSTRRPFSTSFSSTFPKCRSCHSDSNQLATRISKSFQLPHFTLPAKDVQLIEHPRDFYRELLGIISRARRRIYISSLYIGKTETELISYLYKALSSHPDLHLTLLVDAFRSTREGEYDGTSQSESCASLLASLKRDFPHRANIRLYRAPGLPKWLESLVGKRFVEGWGLQHMKVYGGDDQIMVSGANLSNDYFTNRRDRYLLFNSKLMGDYLASLVDVATRFSYALINRVQASSSSREGDLERKRHAPYALSWDAGEAGYDEKRWSGEMGREVEAFTQHWSRKAALREGRNEEREAKDEEKIELVPLLQMGPMKIRQETATVPLLFDYADELASRSRMKKDSVPPILDLTTGYFSFNPQYASRVLSCQAKSHIITASPISNGFYGSKGISRHLPAAYTWLEKQFWKRIVASGRREDVDIKEWGKEGWTYHAKGIWLTCPGDKKPSATLLGSSNFGTRSAHLDLECTFLLDASQSPSFQQRLQEELMELKKDANDAVGQEMFERPERKVYWGVKVATLFIKKML